MFTNILKPTNPQLAAPNTTSIFENSLFPTCMVLIHIALYVMVGMVLNISLSNPSTDELTFSGGMSLNLLREGQLWRAVSSVFSHAGWNHLIGNMIGLWSLLRVLSSSCSRKTLVEIYLLSAVLSNLISLFFLPPAVIVVGASGGVFGLAGFLVLQITKSKIDITSLRKWDGVGIILSLTKSLLIGFTLPQVNNAAHVAGFCVGLAAWFFLSKNVNFHVDSKLRIVFLLGVIALSTGFTLNQNSYLNLNRGKIDLLPSEMAQVAVQFRNEIDKFLEDVKSSKGVSDAEDQIRIRWGRARPQLESLNKKFIELTNESNLSFNLRSFAVAIQLNMSSQLELMDTGVDIKKSSTAVIEAAKRRNYWTAFYLMEVAKQDGQFIHLTNFKDREWRGTFYYILPNAGETKIQAKFTQKGDQIKGDINDFLVESQKPGLWRSEVQGTIAQDLHVQFSTPKRNQITGEVEQTIYDGNFYSGVLNGTFKASNGASGEFVFYQIYNGVAPLSQ